MQTPYISPNVKIVFWINGVLGIVLLIGLYSDYEFSYQKFNAIFPALLLPVSFILLRKAIKSKQLPILHKILAAIPLISGIPYLIAVIVCVFPLTACTCVFAIHFTITGRSEPILLERKSSPNQYKQVETYYSYAGGDGASGGYVEVYVKYKYLPFVRRKIYERWNPEGPDSFQDSIKWISDNQVQFSSTVLRIGIIKIQYPEVFNFMKYFLPLD